MPRVFATPVVLPGDPGADNHAANKGYVDTTVSAHNHDSSYVPKSLIDAKGDVVVGTAADTPARFAVGANGQVLTAASGQSTGLVWSTPPTPAESANAVTFLQRLRDDLGDVSWLIVGDSTGNETTEWVYLTAQTLAARYPTYTVIYHLWDSTGGVAYDTGAAGSATTIQTGSGSNTLHIWNCSIAGSGTFYVRGVRWSAAVLATNPDYITINQGHNEGTFAAGGTADIWRLQMATLTESLSEAFPITPIALTLQNPRGDGTPDPQRRARAYRELAALRGYGIIDVQSVFLAAPGFPTGYIQGDNLHPTTTGSQLWADEVARVLTYSPESRPRYQGPSLLSTPAPNLLVNGDFSNFPSPPTLPHWTAVNCSPAKDTRSSWFEDADGYSVRLQASSAAQTSIYQDIPAGLIDAVKGKYVTLAVRMKVPSGQATTAGRVQLQDSAGTYAAPGSADLRDGWHWAVATKKIDSATTFVRARIYADTGTSATADISVASAHLVIGPLPRTGIPMDSIPIGAAGGSLTGTYPNPLLAAVPITPRTLSTANAAENIDGTVAGDMHATCTANTVFTPTGTPNGRMMVIEGLASGAQRTLAVAGSVLLPTSGGPTTRTLVVPQNSTGVFGLRYSGLRAGWLLLSASVV